jgi:hypothetical protein
VIHSAVAESLIPDLYRSLSDHYFIDYATKSPRNDVAAPEGESHFQPAG